MRCPLVAAGSSVEAPATPCRVREADGSSGGPRGPLGRLAGALPQRREVAVDHAGSELRAPCRLRVQPLQARASERALPLEHLAGQLHPLRELILPAGEPGAAELG